MPSSAEDSFRALYESAQIAAFHDEHIAARRERVLRRSKDLLARCRKARAASNEIRRQIREYFAGRLDRAS